jgi:hypothetical protein
MAAFLAHPLVAGVAAVSVSAVAAAVLAARRRSGLPAVHMQLTEFNRAVLSRCLTINSVYRLIPFLTNG